MKPEEMENDPPVISRRAGYDGNIPIIEGPTRKRTGYRKLNESPFAMLFERGIVDRVLFDAGDRFRRLCERAALSKLGGRDLDFVDSGFSKDVTDAQLSAIKSLQELRDVLGPIRFAVVRGVCGDRESLTRVGEKIGRKADALTLTLVDGLETLADHWGMRGHRGFEALRRRA